MRWTRWTIASLLVAGLLAPGLPAHARTTIPEWVKPAVSYLAEKGWLDKTTFEPNQPMTRRAFTKLMADAFGGGYRRTTGDVRVAEVSAALVKVLGKSTIATGLDGVHSPDGWHPQVRRWFGTEIVAREMGLRYNRLETEDDHETSAGEAMPQADAVYAVWKAKTSPSTWGADALASFELADYSAKRRAVVEFALSLVGTPYVWGGEWQTTTPSSYPYGAQARGGFDCSGFAWYVLRAKTADWRPEGRAYEGWSFPERSSSDMARAAEVKLPYKKLRPGDVVFFAPNGDKARARDVYHAGIYLGKGWMVHSSGSRAGISLASIAPGAWWNDQLMWGRRIITS